MIIDYYSLLRRSILFVEYKSNFIHGSVGAACEIKKFPERNNVSAIAANKFFKKKHMHSKKKTVKYFSCGNGQKLVCHQILKMANTFHQIYLQFVFAVKGTESLIPKVYKEELHKYITGLVQNRKAKMLAIDCMPDHSHIFVGFHPSVLISDFIKEIKVNSNEFLNNKSWTQGKFNWQSGYGVFSYSRSHIDRVIKYILNQEQHHRRQKFREEYIGLLEKFDIPFEHPYLFEFIDY